MLDTQNCLQNHIKNAKATKFILKSAFYTSEERKVLAFYNFWFKLYDKFCSPYPIIEFLRITKIGSRNLKLMESSLLVSVKDRNSSRNSTLARRPAVTIDKIYSCPAWGDVPSIINWLSSVAME